MQVIRLDYPITVTGGTGSSSTNTVNMTTNFNYEVRTISVIAPSASHTWVVTIVDPDGHPIDKTEQWTGTDAQKTNAIGRDPMTVGIAGTDGVYSVRIRMEKK